MFERMIVEDNVRLQFFIQNYNESVLTAFRLKSLRAEAFFEDELRKDIEKGSEELLDWQQRLLNSISNCYKKTATTYEEVKSTKLKAPSIEAMFMQTGNQRLYDIVYRGKSHNIHGDWVEFLQNYLIYDSEHDTFAPKFQENEADIRQLNPDLLICYETLKKFIVDFQGHGLPISLLDELTTDEEIISSFDKMHYDYINH